MQEPCLQANSLDPPWSVISYSPLLCLFHKDKVVNDTSVNHGMLETGVLKWEIESEKWKKRMHIFLEYLLGGDLLKVKGRGKRQREVWSGNWRTSEFEL